MPLYDLKLDPVTHDLVEEGGDGVVISGPEEVKQAVKCALLTWAEEWDLDPTVGWLNTKGMPFGKTVSLQAVAAGAVEVIRNVQGMQRTPPPFAKATKSGRETTIEYEGKLDTGETIRDAVAVTL